MHHKLVQMQVICNNSSLSFHSTLAVAKLSARLKVIRFITQLATDDNSKIQSTLHLIATMNVSKSPTLCTSWGLSTYQTRPRGDEYFTLHLHLSQVYTHSHRPTPDTNGWAKLTQLSPVFAKQFKRVKLTESEGEFTNQYWALAVDITSWWV